MAFFLDTIDLPGIYEDPSTGRVCDTPPSGGTCAPNFNDASKNTRVESSFNHTPIQIRIGRGFYKRTTCKGLPGILNAHQNGLINTTSFTSQLMKIKLRQLKLTNREQLKPTLREQLFQEFNIAFLPEEPIKCKFIIPHNGCYVGAWEGEDSTLINTIKKTCKNRTNESSPPHIVTGINQLFIMELGRENIAHICPVDLDEKPYVLTCSNNDSLSVNDYNYRLLPVHEQGLTHEENRQLPIHEYSSRHIIQCGAWNKEQKLIVIGTKHGVYINKLGGVIHRVSQKNSKAVEISQSGNTIFTISPKGKLILCDLRIPDSIKCAHVGVGVGYMKILSNDHTLITSGFDDKLSNVDTRMYRVMFTYPDFNNKDWKIPFTFIENWSVLCSPGQDNVTRYWDLHTGEVLATLNPPLKSIYQVHSVLTVSENVLSSSIFFGDRMFCYEPL